MASSRQDGFAMTLVVQGYEVARLLDGWQQAGYGPAHRRLATVLGSLLLDGRLPVNARLPSERDLAGHLRVSRATIAAAYARLREEGFAFSRVGAGNWTTLPPRSNRGVAPLLPGLENQHLVDLAIAVATPDPGVVGDAFVWAASELRVVLGDRRAAGGYYQAGIPALREAVAERYTAQGVPTTADQIFVTVGAQGAIHLLASRMAGGARVLIEQPTYPNAVDTFRSAGAQLVAVPVSGTGWQLDQFVDAMERVRPDLAYLIVDFHNPTGAVMPNEDRARLVAAARRYGTLLIIDETMAELAIDGPKPLLVPTFDRHENVITLGSLSKLLWGGLRVGWIRSSKKLVSEMAMERSRIDLAGPVVEQLAAAWLIQQLETLLPVRIAELRERRDVLISAVRTRLPHWELTRPAGGLSLWVTMDRPISTALADAAERYGLRVAPGPRFGLDGMLERFLRIPYSLPPGDLVQAVERLAAAEEDVVSQTVDAGAAVTRASSSLHRSIRYLVS
jgi:DNA-binding transcriptional MocR family regulator